MESHSHSPPKVQHYNYIVVGGGIAGVSCIEQIVQLDPTSKILLLSSSGVVKEISNIQRITKTLNDFVIVERGLQSFHDVHPNVNVLQDSLQELDHVNHTIFTHYGKQFRYDKICICTGASPKELENYDKLKYGDRVIVIRDTDSVQTFCEKLTTSKRVLVVGNGGLATELAFELKNIDIVWSIKDDSISHHYIDKGAAEFLLSSQQSVDCPSLNKMPGEEDEVKRIAYDKRLRYTANSEVLEGSGFGNALGPDWHTNFVLQGQTDSKNISIEYKTEVAQILDQDPISGENSWPVYAQLTNGNYFGIDCIIVAIGVKPNCTIFPYQCYGEDGVYVNERMETKLTDVYAAGDVCCPEWENSKHWFQMRLWTQARQMGLHAGRCMATNRLDPTEIIEKDFCFEMFSHVTKFFGKKVVLLGLYNAQNLPPNSLEYYVQVSGQSEYIKLVVENGRLQGAVLIGETEREETFENLILNQFDISFLGEEILDPGVDIDEYFD